MLEFQGAGGTFNREIQIRRHYEDKISGYQDQLRTLASRLSMTEELERRSVMQELHDGTVQDLAGVQIKLGAIRKLATGHGFGSIIDEVRGEVHHTIQNIRSMIFENTPHLLEGKGLIGAIDWLVQKTNGNHGLSVKFSSDNRIELLDSHYQSFVYRTTRELLINIVKHAQAKQATISIKKVREGLRINICDDGIGFDTGDLDSFAKNCHFGIHNIIERTNHYKGQLKISSQPGKGTQTTILLPLD